MNQVDIVRYPTSSKPVVDGTTITGEGTTLSPLTVSLNLFVQSSAPNFKGKPGVWVQTGLANGGMTIWIEDGL